jgi:hypothetical protein
MFTYTITNYVVYREQAEVTVTLGTCIREMIGLNLGRGIGYPKAFRGSPPEKCRGSPSTEPRWLPSILFPISNSNSMLFALLTETVAWSGIAQSV